MNEQIKWIYRMIVLFLLIMIIDINLNWRQFDPAVKLRLKRVDVILIGVLAFLLLTGWITKKKNNIKGGR